MPDAECVELQLDSCRLPITETARPEYWFENRADTKGEKNEVDGIPFKMIRLALKICQSFDLNRPLSLDSCRPLEDAAFQTLPETRHRWRCVDPSGRKTFRCNRTRRVGNRLIIVSDVVPYSSGATPMHTHLQEQRQRQRQYMTRGSRFYIRP